jgi:hypothetical protein
MVVGPGQSDGMRILMLLLAVVSVVACSGAEPQTPTVTPEKVRVTKISPTGIELLTELDVDNPNSIDLEARSVTAKAFSTANTIWVRWTSLTRSSSPRSSELISPYLWQWTG